MSLIEELESVENRVLARLAELEPLVAEYRELSRIAARLGFDVTPPSAAQPTRRPRAPASASPRPKSSRASGREGSSKVSGRKGSAAARKGGSTREHDVLATVGATPGLTVADVARQLDVAPSSLYRVVRKLTRERALVKRGLALYPGE